MSDSNGKPPQSSGWVDFNDVPPAIDERLSLAANVTLRAALEAIALRHFPGTLKPFSRRRRSICALEGACTVLQELAPAYATKLCAPLLALSTELHDLEAGGGPGEITRPKHVGGHRVAGAAAIEPQARAVLAFDWLKRIGLRPCEAARRVAAAGFGSPKQITDWARYFRRPTAARQSERLKELWYEIEVSQGVDIEAASAEDVIAWLGRAPKER